MPSQATSVDAQLILQLYDLRREAEMRKARSWFAATFSPRSVDEIIKSIGLFGQESAWFRQVLGYWEMAASLVSHGLQRRSVFRHQRRNVVHLGKSNPSSQEYRNKTQVSKCPSRIVEDLATKTEAGRRLQHMVKMHEARRKAS